MTAATLLIFALTNGGYWFGGHPQSLTVRPAAGGLPPTQLNWQLRFGGHEISNGSVEITGEDKPTSITLAIPAFRVRSAVRIVYRLIEKAGGKELDRGEVSLHIFPDTLLQDLPAQIGSKRVAIWDDANGLPRLFEQVKAPYLRIDSPTKLVLLRPDVVLVGGDMVSNSPFEQAPLLHLAEAGASVMLFRQTAPSVLFRYPLASRAAPAKFEWKADHPLINGLTSDDLQSFVEPGSPLRVVQLPADEPALEIGYYPAEIPGSNAGPIDAVFVSKSVGNGRIVLCQLPLGDWQADPRSQVLLADAVDYLLSRPQPTLSPSRRPGTRPVEVRHVPTIEFSPRS